jgi:hypothetical protein
VDPAEYIKHIRRYAGGLTLSVVYGYEAVSNDDEFLSLAEECVGLLSNHIASGGGIWPVDIFPSLRHIPLWMPGSGFKKNAMAWKKKMEEFVDRPYEFVKNSIVSCLCLSAIVHLPDALHCFFFVFAITITRIYLLEMQKMGSHKASFCSNLLEDTSVQDADHFEFDLKWSANSMYSGSIDTVCPAIHPLGHADATFILNRQ